MLLFSIIVFVVIVLSWLSLKLMKSRKFDQFCKNLKTGKLEPDFDGKETMSNISKEKVDLNKQSDKNKKEADKLTKDSQGIDSFLDKDVKKKEGS